MMQLTDIDERPASMTNHRDCTGPGALLWIRRAACVVIAGGGAGRRLLERFGGGQRTTASATPADHTDVLDDSGA